MQRSIVFVLMLLLGGCASTGGPVTRDAIADAAKLHQQAVKAYRERQLMQAFQLASAAVEKNPADAAAWGLLGLIHQRLEQPEAAERAFSRALKLTPDDPALLNNYAGFLCGRKQWDAAQRRFAEAADLAGNPTPEIAWTNAGLCARRAGDSEKAEALLKKAIQHNPGLPTALYQLATLSLEKGRPIEANTWLQQYLNHAVHTPKTLLLGARIEQALDNPAGVETYLEKLRSAFPDSPQRRQAETLANDQTDAAAATPHDDRWLASRDPRHFTVQIGSYSSREQAERAAASLRPPVAIASVGERHLLFQGDYPTLALARAALARLTRSATATAWVRDFGSIQKSLGD